MHARELKELLNAALEHKNGRQLFDNVRLVVSYLISEQAKREELALKLEEHAKRLAQFDTDMLLTKKTVEEIKESSKANNRMLRAILTAVIAGILIEGFKFAFHK